MVTKQLTKERAMFKKLLMTLIVTFMVTNGFSLTYITQNTTWSGNMILTDSYFINPGITLRIAPNSEITFPTGTHLSSPAGILQIGDDVILIGEDNSNYIKLSGRLYMGENILLSAVNSNSHWMGLVLSSCDVPTNIHRAYFRNCDLTVHSTNFDIFYTDFRECEVEVRDSSVGIYNCNFYNANLDIRENGGLVNTNLKLYESLFDGVSPYSGHHLYMEKVYNYIVKGNKFINGAHAITARYCGDGNDRYIAVNSIFNNSGYGLNFHDTHSKIIDGNEISGNNIGILSSGTADIVLQGNSSAPYQKITDNSNYEVVFSCGSFPDTFEYNIITNATHTNLVTCVGHTGLPHYIRRNFWDGPIANPQFAFEPLNGYYWDSIWTPSKSEVVENIANEFTLSQNYPNPFNPTTTIDFSTKEHSKVEMVVFNSGGEEVFKLGERDYNKGNHKIEFDGSTLNSGIYFYRLTVNGVSKTKKMILTK
jgi:hypothetical protein